MNSWNCSATIVTKSDKTIQWNSVEQGITRSQALQSMVSNILKTYGQGQYIRDQKATLRKEN